MLLAILLCCVGINRKVKLPLFRLFYTRRRCNTVTPTVRQYSRWTIYFYCTVLCELFSNYCTLELFLFYTGVRAAHKVNSPKNQSQFSQMVMGQYWLGKTKPLDQPVNRIFYWLTDCDRLTACLPACLPNQRTVTQQWLKLQAFHCSTSLQPKRCSTHRAFIMDLLVFSFVCHLSLLTKRWHVMAPFHNGNRL